MLLNKFPGVFVLSKHIRELEVYLGNIRAVKRKEERNPPLFLILDLGYCFFGEVNEVYLRIF
jgi:hypothetical protein